MWRIRKLGRYLKRLCLWAVFLWNDEEWDYGYLFRVIAFKLERMQKSMEQDTWHVGSEKRARQLLVCKNLMRRLAEDDYCSKEFNEHWEKYPINWTEPAPRRDRKEFKWLFEKEEALYQADLELFFKLFKSHHRGWWS